MTKTFICSMLNGCSEIENPMNKTNQEIIEELLSKTAKIVRRWVESTSIEKPTYDEAYGEFEALFKEALEAKDSQHLEEISQREINAYNEGFEHATEQARQEKMALIEGVPNGPMSHDSLCYLATHIDMWKAKNLNQLKK